MKNIALLFFISVLSITVNLKAQTTAYPIADKMDPAIQKILDNVDNFDSAVGKQFGQFIGIDIAGKAVTEKFILGKVTLINFWFEACPSCHLQFGNLNGLQERFQGDSNFQVIGITFDPIEIARLNVVKNGIKYNVVSLPREMCTKLNFSKGYPCNFIIDQSGKIVFGHLGSGKFGTDAYKGIIIPKIDSLLYQLKIDQWENLAK